MFTKIKTKIKKFFEKLENSRLQEELTDRINEIKEVNLKCTFETLKNYLAEDMLQRTGLLYNPNDKYIQTRAQQIFWEWKREGIIDFLEDFVPATKAWIDVYAR